MIGHPQKSLRFLPEKDTHVQLAISPASYMSLRAGLGFIYYLGPAAIGFSRLSHRVPTSQHGLGKIASISIFSTLPNPRLVIHWLRSKTPVGKSPRCAVRRLSGVVKVKVTDTLPLLHSLNPVIRYSASPTFPPSPSSALYILDTRSSHVSNQAAFRGWLFSFSESENGG